MFLDAGGVLVNPNWSRVSRALAEHGVSVGAPALAAAEPRAKKRLDTGAALQAGFHVIGDAALDTVLEGFRRAAERIGIAAVRAGGHRLEHVESPDADA